MGQRNLDAASRPVVIWFRRDLRLADHAALNVAIQTGAPILPVFVHDDDTPGEWRLGGASRWWLAQSLRSLDESLRKRGSRLILRQGRADSALLDVAKEAGASAIYFTRGYEPFQRTLEDRIRNIATEQGIDVRRFGGHILFEPEKLLNKAGDPFRVYTPFSRAAFAQYLPGDPLPAPARVPAPEIWPASDRLESWGLEPTKPDWAGGMRAFWSAGEAAAQTRLQHFVERILAGYEEERNLPGRDSTSRLSPHLAFGEISPRQVWHAVSEAAEASGKTKFGETYLKEILWREFSYHLLFHFPHLPDRAFKPEFDRFPWGKTEARLLSAWERGQTGYPIVDAGMRQLWQTGWMHNRVRMIVASFLIKHLLVPWQTGEKWFWDTLVDADLASNAASWQWVAGSGADAAPYFRIFNPTLQGAKFDPDGDYIRTYCPELAKLPKSLIHTPWEADSATLSWAVVFLGKSYPHPIVDHAQARARALSAYEKIKGI